MTKLKRDDVMRLIPTWKEFKKWTLPSRHSSLGLVTGIFGVLMTFVLWAISERALIADLFLRSLEPPDIDVCFQATETGNANRLHLVGPLEAGSLIWLNVRNTSAVYPILDLRAEIVLPCCVTHSFLESKGGCLNPNLENDLTSFDENLTKKTNFLRLSVDRIAPSSSVLVGLCVDDDFSSYLEARKKAKRETYDVSTSAGFLWYIIDNQNASLKYVYSWKIGDRIKRVSHSYEIVLVQCNPLIMTVDYGTDHSKDRYFVTHIMTRPLGYTSTVAQPFVQNIDLPDQSTTKSNAQRVWEMVDKSNTNSTYNMIK